MRNKSEAKKKPVRAVIQEQQKEALSQEWTKESIVDLLDGSGYIEEWQQFNYDDFVWSVEDYPTSKLFVSIDFPERLDQLSTKDAYPPFKGAWVDKMEEAPILVVQNYDGGMAVEDGNHRSALAIEMGLPTIPAMVGRLKRATVEDEVCE